MPTVWRLIPSLPEYIACSDGSVMRLPFVGPMPSGGARQYGGQPHYGVSVPADTRPLLVFKDKSYRISRLVCEAFHGTAPFPGAVVMHVNDDQTDNRESNLRWGTQKENLNTERFLAYCRGRTGENSPTAKGRRARAGGQRT